MTRRKDGITCTAKAKSTGKRCGNPPIPGGTTCRIHGGKAPQVLAAGARRVMEALVGPALLQYDRLIRDPMVDDRVKAPMIRDLLDRTGYKAPTQIELQYLPDSVIEAEIERLEEEQGL